MIVKSERIDHCRFQEVSHCRERRSGEPRMCSTVLMILIYEGGWKCERKWNQGRWQKRNKFLFQMLEVAVLKPAQEFKQTRERNNVRNSPKTPKEMTAATAVKSFIFLSLFLVYFVIVIAFGELNWLFLSMRTRRKSANILKKCWLYIHRRLAFIRLARYGAKEIM